jgi:hypothetical protein
MHGVCQRLLKCGRILSDYAAVRRFVIDGAVTTAIENSRVGNRAGRETMVSIGATEMKILIVAAAAGLMTLAACTPTATNNTTTVENTTEEANVAVYENVTETAVDNAMPAMNETTTTVETSNTTTTNTM